MTRSTILTRSFSSFWKSFYLSNKLAIKLTKLQETINCYFMFTLLILWFIIINRYILYIFYYYAFVLIKKSALNTASRPVSPAKPDSTAHKYSMYETKIYF